MINLLEEKPVNIAGVIFTAQLDNVKQVAEELGRFPGVEVHVTGENGNMVVTIEESLITDENIDLANHTQKTNNQKTNTKNKSEKGEKPHRLIDTITAMSNVPGVISSSLVFHHNDSGLPQHQGKKL